jgi:type II secretory pathway component PulM
VKRSPYIGELRARGFLIAVAAFLLLGAFLYSKFEFQTTPTPADEISKQEKRIDELQKRIDQIANATSDAHVGQTTDKQAPSSKPSPNEKARPINQPKH